MIEVMLEILVCPVCKSNVKMNRDELICVNEKCKLKFPIIDGIPIMLPFELMEDLKLTQQKWDDEYKCYNTKRVDFSNDQELQDAYNHVKKYIKPKKGLFLEAGCGPSKLSCLLAKECIHTVGIDLSLNALRLAKELFKREGINGFFVCGDLLEMPFKDNIFSYVYTGGVLEHFKDTQTAVNEIYRCLGSGGFTSNTVPYISLSTFYRILRWGNIPDIPLIRESIEFIEVTIFRGRFMRFGYEKSFTSRKIKKIFQTAGFKNIEIDLFKAYYPLEIIPFTVLKSVITKIVNSSKLLWPMIYINGEK